VKRFAVLVVALAVFAPVTAAHAAVPCRDRIYNDWYADGKIATTYPLACYSDALKHVPTDAREYSSLADDIRAAMLGARQRLEGRKQVPTQIGRGTLRATENANGQKSHDKAPSTSSAPHDPKSDGTPAQTQTTPPPSTLAAGETSGGSSGIPVPLLVLGGLAILLVAAGLIGAVAKRRGV
jgi:hypothetical protein